MPRMTAARAAVEILRREGITHLFGLPGAAINPFYSAVRAQGELQHVLARHVEGASHMAEGYTRAEPGNIGVCVGTSGPAGTDMITGLYSASTDSIPILCITGPDDILPALDDAKKLLVEHQVPVVVEVILERITNVAMGTEIDDVVEFEELADVHNPVPTASGPRRD